MILPIPAIDLLQGTCVRLLKGQYDQVTAYDDNPVGMALHWESLGAQRLHIVDLDAARSGGSVNNTDLIAKMCEAIAIPVQTGGGLRTLEDIDRALGSGANCAIIGTAAVLNPDLLATAVRKFGPDHIAAGIDAKDNKVRIQGWTEGSALDAVELARDMERRGVRRIIYTDIDRDGALQGPNIKAYESLGRALAQCKITASGGVAALSDLEALAPLAAVGVDSVIIGRALYENTVDPNLLWR